MFSFAAAVRRSGYRSRRFARVLLIASDRTIRRWEQGELTVPAWVALEDLLRKSNEIALADKVAQVVQQRRVEMY